MGNDVGIHVENTGCLVALESTLGEKQVDRILSIGLSLLATQAPIEFVNPGPLIVVGAKLITVLQMQRL